MQTPLNASASTAGALVSSSTFEVPQFQREYSWEEDEISEFWSDLRTSIDAESYFLGLVILTDDGKRKSVVDGQQRLLTLSLLANALYYEALKRGRKALADRIQADFLSSIDYESDETNPRVIMSDEADNSTFQYIIATGEVPSETLEEGSVSQRLAQSYEYLTERLREDLRIDPFKRLGKWTEFLTHRVYFTVFIHPDPSSAYQVYEVINTRGKELTTADLLKNYILSQTPKNRRQARYRQWQAIAQQFDGEGASTFVQYIRHVVTTRCGHILPKDLFGFLAMRGEYAQEKPPAPSELMTLLEEHLPLYLQMIDPRSAGPADSDALKVFSALNSLGVIAVRPILLAVADVPRSLDGMKYVLKLVVRRIVVGNLGTGNVERRLGEAAKKVHDRQTWKALESDLGDLNPTVGEFSEQLRKRSLNKGILAFLRRSILAESITPDDEGVLHFIWTRQSSQWNEMSEEDGAYWGATIGNTFLSEQNRRPKGASDWAGFKEHMLPYAVSKEWRRRFVALEEWDAAAVETMGKRLARVAGEVWFR
ncbi:DUF262 domain-containing protein [soil metagenome]